MQASRLLSILMLLQARGRMTAPALAQALEVSVRTVLRDVDSLSAAGVPIWSDRGRSGGFQLKAGWSTQLTGLTEPEAQALFLGGLPSAATELGLGAAATSAQLKMLAALPSEWREQASSVASRLHIDPIDWYRTAEAPDKLEALQQIAHAVWSSQRIRFEYQSWNTRAWRTVDPLGLVLKAGAWYLVAQPVGKLQALTFRLANVRALERSEVRFKRPARFDLAAHWRASTEAFEAGLYRHSARVLASPRARVWLDNARIKTVALVDEPLPPGTPQGWSLHLLPMESIEHGVRQLLGYASEVRVLGPDALREAFLAELERMLAAYQK